MYIHIENNSHAFSIPSHAALLYGIYALCALEVDLRTRPLLCIARNFCNRKIMPELHTTTGGSGDRDRRGRGREDGRGLLRLTNIIMPRVPGLLAGRTQLYMTVRLHNMHIIILRHGPARSESQSGCGIEQALYL